MENFNGIKPFIVYDSFNYMRSFENIKEFQISGMPKNTFVAVLINRQVQVYDYFLNEIMF